MLALCLTLPLLVLTADPEPAAKAADVVPDVVGIEPDLARGESAAVLVRNGALVHTGQILPWGPQHAPTPPDHQVAQAFAQLGEVLKSAESQLADVVKLNVYVRHPSVTALVEAQLKTVFAKGVPPAVSWVQTTLPDPATVVAVEAVARIKSPAAGTVRLIPSVLKNEPAQAAILPEGGVAYISGQAEKGDGTLADATRQTMASLLRSVAFLKSSPERVVSIKAFLLPMTEAAVAMQEIRAAFGTRPCPPVSLVEWSSSLPIEIEMIVATDLPTAQESRPAPIDYLTPPGMTTPTVYCRVARVNVPGRIYVGGLFGASSAANSEAEAREIFERLESVVNRAGGDLEHLAKGTYYVSHDQASNWFTKVRPDYYRPTAPPAASKAMVAGTGKTGRSLTLDMIAVPRPVAP